MKLIKSILVGLVLRGVMLLVGIAWAVALKLKMLWKGYKHKSKHN